MWYILARYPEHANRVYQELVSCDIGDINSLAALPHLNAVIDETMRLMPAAMTGTNRMTPQQGLYIDQTWIPGNTKIAAPKYSIMRRELTPSTLLDCRFIERNCSRKCFSGAKVFHPGALDNPAGISSRQKSFCSFWRW